MMFVCDPAEQLAAFGSEGFAVWQAGVSDEFVAGARAQVAEVREQLEGPARRPFVERDFALPESDSLAEILEFAGALTQTEASSWTLAECQLKGYGLDIAPTPNLHKDRTASELAVGIPLHLPGRSFVVLYPDHAREPNRFVTANDYNARASFRERPEVALLGASPRRIASAVADVVAFPGSSMFHGRERSAGVVVLYLKLNRMGLDPCGVDPRTYASRRASLALVDVEDARLLMLELSHSPLLTKVVCERCRAERWNTVEIAEIAGHKPIVLTTFERDLVLQVDGPMRVGAWIERLGVATSDSLAALRRLVRAGALDLRELEERGDGR